MTVGVKIRAHNMQQRQDEGYLFMTYLNPQVMSKDVWYLDSACSNHMTGDREKFRNVDETLYSQVRLGDDKQVQVEGTGNVVVTLQKQERFIPDVHYAPGLAYNLLSVGQLMDRGFDVFFNSKNKTCTVIKNEFANEVNKEESTDVWHQRYGHLYVKGLQLLVNKEMVKGLPIIKKREHTCEGCPLGKQARKSFPVAQAKRAEEKLELVHADICGPMKTDSYAEAFGFFKKFKALAENQSYRKLKVLRTDRGGEFLSKEFSGFSNEHGIKRELIAPYTPEHNGIAERKNRTIVEMARYGQSTEVDVPPDIIIDVVDEDDDITDDEDILHVA
nr:retrovirus-related Pol polyprotein from transposon TNT 1-94 [Tanacetum cinerariifolium]